MSEKYKIIESIRNVNLQKQKVKEEWGPIDFEFINTGEKILNPDSRILTQFAHVVSFKHSYWVDNFTLRTVKDHTSFIVEQEKISKETLAKEVLKDIREDLLNIYSRLMGLEYNNPRDTAMDVSKMINKMTI